ncbi:MAG: bifunctional riboflavin kinase/FAD synthetase [Armatimonadota bacterium]
MRRIEDLPPVQPSVVAVGVFDGVHLGHQAIMRTVCESAKMRGCRSVVVTFDRNPEELMSGPEIAPHIMSLRCKLALIEEQGIDLALVLPLDKRILTMTADEFMDAVLRCGLGAVEVVVGPDFVFGRNRAGNTATLREAGVQLGFAVTIVPPVVVGETVASSTEIRRLIQAGEIERANELLGRPFILEGRVARGEGIGTKLGFPTANIAPEVGEVIPPEGVYAVWVNVGGTRYAGAANIGRRPTVCGKTRTIEVHIIGFSGDLYGQNLDVEFRRRLRDEIKFRNVEELVAQIAKDVALAGRV